MPNIDDLPAAVTSAGTDHNYTGVPFATVTLVSAPVSSTRKTVARRRAAYDAYIDAEVASGRALVQQIQTLDPRPGFKLDTTVNAVMGFNYARVVMGSQSWYLIIDEFVWRSARSVEFRTSVDPFATYPYTLGYSMVNTAHAGVAAGKDDTYGNRYCQAPEPIAAPPAAGVMAVDVLSSNVNDWTVLVVSSNDLRGVSTAPYYFEPHVEQLRIIDAERRAYKAAQAPLLMDSDIYDDYYPTGEEPGGHHGYLQSDFHVDYPWSPTADSVYVPVVAPSPVSRIDGVAQGGGAYLFTPVGWSNWVRVMQSASWVIEGIVSVRYVPNWALSNPASGGGGSIDVSERGPRTATDPMWTVAAGIPHFEAEITTGVYDATVLAGWRDQYLAAVGAEGYRKLITGAHVKIIVGTGDSATEYDPSFMQTDGVNIHARTGMAHGENSIRLTVDYNEMTDQMGTTLVAGGSPGMVTNGYGRAAGSTASATLAPANSAFTNMASREAAEYNNMLARHSETTKVGMNAGIIGVQSVLQAGGGAALAGLAGGGPWGAVAGAVVGGGSAAVTAGVSSNNSLDLLDIALGGSLDILSYQLANNGAFSTMSFRAWLQGLEAVSGRGVGAAMASAWRAVTGQAFRVIVMAPAFDHVQQLLSQWRRYGYSIGRAFQPSQLNVMSAYSYWKTTDAQILGNMPDEARAQIAAAFDAGVTVYESLSDIGRDVSNTPLNGVSY
jgi:hypothetical protein